ncbi:MAG: tryptophan synthase subunit alpha [Gemmataceae bacterium]|nr:tryptophan synthase subunit alpha [Gemmataceae bacterium]
MDELFANLKSQRRKAFIPFLTAGDPDLDTTARLVQECARRGASLVEIGFPYSDPIADGSVVQASYTRALDKGLRIADIFAAVRKWQASVPLVAMVSYSLVHFRGPHEFVHEAEEAGFSGAIVPDLPIEEAAELAETCKEHEFKLIQLVTPTTPRERAERIARLSTGFLYCVSVVGITGERAQIPAELFEQLRWLRTTTSLPLCAGFGISKPEHAALLRDHADGIIVGSAIVRRLERIGAADQAIAEIGELVESLVKTVNAG